MRRILILAAVALLATGCAGPTATETTIGIPTEPTPVGIPSTTPDAAAGFVLTSPDFVDGGELADWATASAFGGQCTGDNLNPALEWTGAPEGTAAFAITMLDRSAGNFIHWLHGDIPGDVSGIERGGSADLPGFVGRNQGVGTGYFGPCPPGPDHRYEFTVYALDAPLGLTDGAGLADFKAGLDGHLLGSASITGNRSGPAD